VPSPDRRCSTKTALSALAALVGATTMLAACGGGDGGGDTEAFCRDVADHQDELFNAQIDTLDQARDLLAAMRSAGADAPLAIEADWQHMTDMLGALVDASVPYDNDDIATVYASHQSALAVQEWLHDQCGVDVAVGQLPNPLPTAAPTSAPAPG